jgi:hypothetical protein
MRIVLVVMLISAATFAAAQEKAQPDSESCFDMRWSQEKIKDIIDMSGNWDLKVYLLMATDERSHHYTEDFFYHTLHLEQSERGSLTGKMVSDRNQEFQVCGEVWTRGTAGQHFSAARLHFTRRNYHAMEMLKPNDNPHAPGETPESWIGYFLDQGGQMGMVELRRAAEEP